MVPILYPLQTLYFAILYHIYFTLQILYFATIYYYHHHHLKL